MPRLREALEQKSETNSLGKIEMWLIVNMRLASLSIEKTLDLERANGGAWSTAEKYSAILSNSWRSKALVNIKPSFLSCSKGFAQKPDIFAEISDFPSTSVWFPDLAKLSRLCIHRVFREREYPSKFYWFELTYIDIIFVLNSKIIVLFGLKSRGLSMIWCFNHWDYSLRSTSAARLLNRLNRKLSLFLSI